MILPFVIFSLLSTTVTQHFFNRHPDNKKNKKQRQPDVPPETPVMNISDRDCDIRSRYRSKSYAEILQNDIPIPRNDQRLQTTALLCSSSTTYNIMDIAQMSSSTGAKSPLSIETTAQSEYDKSGNTNLGTNRKPCLVLDLDDTLIRSEDFVGCSLGTRRTDDSKVYGTHPPNKGDNYRIRDFGIIDTDTYDVVIEEGVFTLHIRPGARVFIQEMSVYFELAVCSLGTREYVSRIVAILDPDSVLFGGRILDRDDLSDGVKDIPSEWAPDGDFLVIDDLPSVWKPGTRVIRVPRFFCKETELAAYRNSGVLSQLSKFIKTVFADYQMQSANNCVQENTYIGLLDRIYNKSLNGTWVFDISYKEANSLEEILNAIIRGQQEERKNEAFGSRNNSDTITSRQRSYSVPASICF